MIRALGSSMLMALASMPVLAGGCGSNGSGDLGTTSDGAGANGMAGGGGTAGGGSGSGSGGSKNVGGGKSGGGAAGANAGCHDTADCPVPSGPPLGGITQCLSPGQVAPVTSCGAPMWCGQCSCPPEPIAPLGTGQPCETSQDCPLPSDTEAAASLCVSSQCTRCAQNSDCAANTPVCTAIQGQFVLGFQTCTECALDTDCPGERPYCQNLYGMGECVACRAALDCAQGHCVDGACTPECGPNEPCASALNECNAELRCGPLSCADDSACPANHGCNPSGCLRRSCDDDTDCDDYCVNGICYESLGTCHTQYAAP